MTIQQRGQAITEFLFTAVFILVPLLIGMVLLVKYIETRHSVEQASRYVAWERTAWFQKDPGGDTDAAVKTETQLKREVNWRFFNKYDRAIDAEDKDKNWAWQDGLNPMLRDIPSADKTNRGAILASYGSNGSVTKTKEKQTGMDMSGLGVGGLENAVYEVLELLGGDAFSNTGVYTSSVGVKFATLPKILQSDNNASKSIGIQRKHKLLATGWNAGGPDDARNKAARLTIFGALEQLPITGQVMDGVELVQDVAGSLPMFKEFSSDCLNLGHVDVDAVPDQRLGWGADYKPKRCNY